VSWIRAPVYDAYGGPEQLRFEDLPRPDPGAGQVRVRIEATGLFGSDTEFLTGRPAYARPNGLRRPSNRILGSDIAGIVGRPRRDRPRARRCGLWRHLR